MLSSTWYCIKHVYHLGALADSNDVNIIYTPCSTTVDEYQSRLVVYLIKGFDSAGPGRAPRFATKTLYDANPKKRLLQQIIFKYRVTLYIHKDSHGVRRTIWVLLHPKYCKTSRVPLQKWTSMILSRKCANGCKWHRISLLAYLCCAYLTSSFSALWGSRSPREPPFCPLEPFQLPARHGDTWQLQFGTAMRNVTPNKATINHGNLRVHPQCHPAQEIRPYQGVMVSWWWIISQKGLISWGGGWQWHWGAPLGLHESTCTSTKCFSGSWILFVRKILLITKAKAMPA